MDNKTTGSFISTRRKELSLNQKQLAERLGVTDKAVSKWETGRSAPDIALLEPLARELGVSVVEILQGEKVEEKNFTAVSDEVVVKTMKKDKKKLRRTVAFTVGIVISLVLVTVLSYPAYHFFTTVSIDNEDAVLKEISGPWLKGGQDYRDFRIVKSEKKANFYFYLLTDGKKAYMSHCEKDPLYENRISFWGGTSVSEPNEVGLYGYGHNYMTFNVFFGYGMTDTEYSYYYRGVKSIKPIEDEYFMDVLIDINDDHAWANIIYND